MALPDYIYDPLSGVILPQTAFVLAQVIAEYQEAFGADLIVTPDTPQGMLIVAETLARIEVLRINADLANQINPNLAGGVFLDAIFALTGSERNPQVYSTVPGLLTGVATTVIPAGLG